MCARFDGQLLWLEELQAAVQLEVVRLELRAVLLQQVSARPTVLSEGGGGSARRRRRRCSPDARQLVV